MSLECEKRNQCIEETLRDLMLNRFFEILKGVELTDREWKPVFRVEYNFMHYPNPQPKQVPEYEAVSIRQLHEEHPKFSIEDLAWIFMRSKSTIHAVLNGKHKRKKNES